ncbi:translesion DNA synthesis-associated protein ImuA [Marinimicrobium sp. ABcell2]|uniref:translesion DNA synthesis-associated protein ImuA n=1 Tax=Marinimicrobium sp. ABcell2 TaxID=3069751 RepID=UPI0027B87429|nr:translesion DNA synthesis-associated protein ImuA [Marinimicrobium sp. ABcell2]MDQ2077765.1 translesion DNA synthesis-associated protein ImuA [Marinimicrobium sp. ABcell2]
MNSVAGPEATNPMLQALTRRRLVWRGGAGLNQETRSTGLPQLDDKLGGGFPAQGVIDVRSPRGIGELRLFMASLAGTKSPETRHRLCVFIAPPLELHAEGLAGAGLDLTRVLIVRPSVAAEALWAAEQSLKSGACHAVVLWQDSMTLHQARRLQLAAQEGQAQLLLLRHSEATALPASLCLQLTAHARGLVVGVPKRRGGWPVADFILDLQSQWPELTLAPAPRRPLPLTGVQAV